MSKRARRPLRPFPSPASGWEPEDARKALTAFEQAALKAIWGEGDRTEALIDRCAQLLAQERTTRALNKGRVEPSAADRKSHYLALAAAAHQLRAQVDVGDAITAQQLRAAWRPGSKSPFNESEASRPALRAFAALVAELAVASERCAGAIVAGRGQRTTFPGRFFAVRVSELVASLFGTERVKGTSGTSFARTVAILGKAAGIKRGYSQLAAFAASELSRNSL